MVLVRDLLLASRVTAVAKSKNIPIKLIRDPAALVDKIARMLIVDLNLAGALEAAIAWKSATSAPVIAFSAHTDTQAIASARAAGLDQVLPRSRFVQEIESLLTATGSAPHGN